MPKAGAAESTPTTIPYAEFARNPASILEQLTRDDPLWELVGSAADAPPTDAAKKHEYLAEAYSSQP